MRSSLILNALYNTNYESYNELKDVIKNALSDDPYIQRMIDDDISEWFANLRKYLEKEYCSDRTE